jgi:hypothetical protein
LKANQLFGKWAEGSLSGAACCTVRRTLDVVKRQPGRDFPAELTLVPRERKRRDESRSGDHLGGLTYISRINRRHDVAALPTSQTIAIEDKSSQRKRIRKEAFKMKIQASVSDNRTASDGRKTHRFAPALAPLRCARPDGSFQKKEKSDTEAICTLDKIKAISTRWVSL